MESSKWEKGNILSCISFSIGIQSISMLMINAWSWPSCICSILSLFHVQWDICDRHSHTTYIICIAKLEINDLPSFYFLRNTCINIQKWNLTWLWQTLICFSMVVHDVFLKLVNTKCLSKLIHNNNIFKFLLSYTFAIYILVRIQFWVRVRIKFNTAIFQFYNGETKFLDLLILDLPWKVDLILLPCYTMLTHSRDGSYSDFYMRV